MLKSRLTVIMALIALLGVSLFTVGIITRQIHTTDTQLTAIIKWSSYPRDNYNYFAEYDFVAFSPGISRAFFDSLRVRNGDIMAGMYFNVHTVAHWMADSRPGTYTYSLWQSLASRHLTTTTGDTACIWQNNPLYDFTDPGVRATAINLLAAQVEANKIDWLFLDFFATYFYDLKAHPNVPQIYRDLEEGEWDFDGDGIPYDQDTDEQALMIAAQYDYIRELGAALPGVLLIPNGDLALKRDDFAALVDGLFLEQFPMYNWGSVGPRMDNALDINYPHSLPAIAVDRYRTPTYYIFIEDRWNVGNYGVIAAMFDNVVEAKNMRTTLLPPLPRTLDLIDPQPLEINEAERFLRRAFRDTTYIVRY